MGARCKAVVLAMGSVALACIMGSLRESVVNEAFLQYISTTTLDKFGGSFFTPYVTYIAIIIVNMCIC